MGIRLNGIRDLRRILATAEPKIRIAVNQEIHKIANEMLSKSKALVPFEDGILRGSGILKQGGAGSGTVTSQTVEYGGPAAPYALVQHENMRFFHPAKARGGVGPGTPGQTRGAKYLEIPAKEAQVKLVPRLIAAIKGVT